MWRLHYIPSRVHGGRLGLWGCGGGWSDESKGDDGAMSRAMTRVREETPLHGAFRCHQTDGTPQPHARSKRDKASIIVGCRVDRHGVLVVLQVPEVQRFRVRVPRERPREWRCFRL